MSSRRSSLLVTATLPACVVAGLLLRLEPARRAGVVEFDREAALHFRMVRALVETGSVPAVDPLGLPPDGMPVAALLPTLPYQAIAGWHRLLAALGLGGDLQHSAVSFTALFGSLIALPLYAAGRGVGLRPGFACLGAAFAALSPTHVARTAGHGLAPAAPVALLVTSHVAALAVALASGRGRGLAIGGAFAGAALAAAIAAWREAEVFVAVEALIVLGLFLMRALRPPLLIAFAPSLALALATSLVVPHLMTGPFLLSRTGALAFLTLGLLLLDAATALHARRGRRAWIARGSLVAAILAVSFGLGRASAHDRWTSAMAAKLGSEDAADAGAFLLSTAPLALVYALGRTLPRRQSFIAPPGTVATGAGLILWHGMAAAVAGLTFVFAYDPVLASSFLALYPALLADGAFKGPGFPRRRVHIAIAFVLATSLAWTALDALRLARTLPARLDPDLRSALTWIAAHARPGDVVLGDWERGHVIQLMTGLPTVIDGRTELPEMRRRVEEFAQALLSEDDGQLLLLCRRHRARYLWVSAGRHRAYARAAGIRDDDDLAGGRPAARGPRTNEVRLLEWPHGFPGLVPRIWRGRERIFEVRETP